LKQNFENKILKLYMIFFRRNFRNYFSLFYLSKTTKTIGVVGGAPAMVVRTVMNYGGVSHWLILWLLEVEEIS